MVHNKVVHHYPGSTSRTLIDFFALGDDLRQAPVRPEKIHDPSFKWKVYGFSALLERGATPANSTRFHCCGYKCRVSFKPGHTMNALFELSVYNHSNGTYYGGKDSCSSTVKKTHSKKMCLIPLEVLKSSDYLVDDSCVVGKPLVISKKHITVQNLFLQKKEFIRGTYTWTMSNYLDLKLLVNSPAFEVGGHKWYVNMYPLGDKYSTKSLSLFLHLHDPKELPDPKSGMMIELTLSILDVKHGKHFTRRFVFAAGDKAGWGWSNFIRLKTFKDPSRGYLLGSNCVLKADITITGSSNDG
ncbi:hypothetical protein SETIT_9G221600v2 [Setaria italica]|uniref:MATH domain-containing protein n=1 Tax=Setaria italica TaxID=4555 RepID=A0A368SJ84_SETIT|nr:hypothetical protein SETIT_9G221600v2 [Setaria italica]